MAMPYSFEMIFFEAIIVPMNYSTYSDLFNRLSLPAGHRGHVRAEASRRSSLLDTAVHAASRTIATDRPGG
jgi:hypothetical protein